MKNNLLILIAIVCFCFIACDEVEITPEPTPVPPPGNYYGEGTDGALNVNTSVIINNVSSRLAFAQTAGNTYIQVIDEPGFAADDELFIYDSRGTGAGTYEFVTITQVSGTVLDLESPLENNYPETDLVFVYRVPHYTTIYVYDGGTITANTWNETTGGGIVVFRATESINIIGSGKIDVSGKGYQGHNRQADGESGFQGEGYPGIGIQSTSQNGNGGGGGGVGNGQEGAGGGGGHAFNGMDGEEGAIGIGGTGGMAVGNPELRTLFFGGAGGTGTDNDNTEAENPNGGSGGGIIFISSPHLYIKNIIADGGNGNICNPDDGGAGGGAGGSIYILSDEVNIMGDITSLGGIGFTTNSSKGGDGSVGRIRIKADYIDGFTFPAYYSD